MEDWGAFIPQDRRRALAVGKRVPQNAVGTALLTDISGFTSLLEDNSLSFGPQKGAEEVTSRLNAFFGRLNSILDKYEGSVISFSGDGATCWFDGDDGSRGVRCALELQKAYTEYRETRVRQAKDSPLGVKISLAHGTAQRLLVGDPQIQLVDMMAGEVFQKIARMDSGLTSGEVGLDKNVVAFLPVAEAELGKRKTSADELFYVMTSDAPFTKKIQEPDTPAPLPSISESAAKPWLMNSVYRRMQRGNSSFLADLRLAAIFFLRFEIEGLETDSAACEDVRKKILFIQTTLARYEGTLLQIVAGDKGGYLYGAFGAPVAHENEANLALAALLEVRDRGPESGLRGLRVGVSQGMIYAGVYGGSTRKTYGVIGKEVNLASRIMETAPEGAIVVSASVHRAAQHYFHFDPEGERSFRGFQEKIQLYKVLAARPRHEIVHLGRQFGTPMAGRDAELSEVRRRFDLLAGDIGGCVLVEGEPGIGKSRFAEELEFEARRKGLLVFKNGTDYIENKTPYFVWRPIFQEILSVDPFDDRTAEQNKVAAQFRDESELFQLVPLLGPVLALPFADNDWTDLLSGESRANLTVDLLVTLLARAVRLSEEHLVLILEDAHWMDQASWSLLTKVLAKLPQVLAVVTSRIVAAGTEPAFDALLARPELVRLHLGPLPPLTVLELVKSRLGVRDFPVSVEEFLTQKAEGNPFFSLELAFALRDLGVLVVQNGKASLSATFQGWDRLPFPDTLHGAIASRIDRLPTEAQEILKVASVIGRRFNYSTLEGLGVEPNESSNLAENLNLLIRLELVVRQPEEFDPVYAFQHALIQQATYDLLLFQQKRDLHRRVAEWYETRFAENLEPYASVLAHHWREAGFVEKAVDFFVRAGQEALRQYSNLEALTHFQEALRLEDTLESPHLKARQRGEVELAMGEAYLQNSALNQAVEHYEIGLELLGWRIPANGMVVGAKVVHELFRQRATRRRGVSHGSASGANRETLISICRTIITLVETYMATNRLPKAIYATIAGVNLAESLGLEAERARSYSYCAVLLDFLGFKNSALDYIKLAEEALSKTELAKDRILTTLAIGFFYSGRGMFHKASERFMQLGNDALAVGDHRRFRDSLLFQILNGMLQGQFRESRILTGQLLEESAKSLDLSMKYVAWSLDSLCNFFLGSQTNEAIVSLLYKNLSDNIDEMHRQYGVLALALSKLSSGLIKEALKYTDEVHHFFSSKRTILYSEFYLAFLPSEVYLRCRLAGLSANKWAVNFHGSINSSRRFCKSYTMGQPAYYYLVGLYESIRKHENRAIKNWKIGLKESIRLGMRYYEGKILMALADASFLPNEDRTAFAKDALKCFNQLGILNPKIEENGPLSGLRKTLEEV